MNTRSQYLALLFVSACLSLFVIAGAFQSGLLIKAETVRKAISYERE
jgi:hypothetical protein